MISEQTHSVAISLWVSFLLFIAEAVCCSHNPLPVDYCIKSQSSSCYHHMHVTYHHKQSLLSKLAPQRKWAERRRGFSKRKTYQGFVLFTSSPPAHGDGDSCDFFETVIRNHILLRQ